MIDTPGGSDVKEGIFAAFATTDLIAAIAQDHFSGEVLMLAWMNEAALRETLRTGRAVYWSRSRSRLWRKGEESGHIQKVVQLRLDCDCDAVLMKVIQHGPACHTGRRNCFFRLVTCEDKMIDDPLV